MPPAIIWDRFIRSGHWSIAALFFANYYFLAGGESLHEWGGYLITALVILRLIWGFIGPPNARIADFFPTPNKLIHYLRNFPHADKHHPGHNPLGGVMVLFLWGMLLMTAVTGWMQDLDRYWGEAWVQDLHEVAATCVMAAVVVHIVAVVVMIRITGVSLIRAMITGRRR